MKWQCRMYTFKATSSSTTLTFTSTTAGAFGPALDQVVVTETAATGANCKDDGWRNMFEQARQRVQEPGCLRQLLREERRDPDRARSDASRPVRLATIRSQWKSCKTHDGGPRPV